MKIKTLLRVKPNSPTFWNWTHKNIPVRQHSARFLKSQNVLNHSPLLRIHMQQGIFFMGVAGIFRLWDYNTVHFFYCHRKGESPVTGKYFWSSAQECSSIYGSVLYTTVYISVYTFLKYYLNISSKRESSFWWFKKRN